MRCVAVLGYGYLTHGILYQTKMLKDIENKFPKKIHKSEAKSLECFRSEETNDIFKISKTAKALVVWMFHPLVR